MLLRKSHATVAEAIVHAAVEANVRTPVSRVESINPARKPTTEPSRAAQCAAARPRLRGPSNTRRRCLPSIRGVYRYPSTGYRGCTYTGGAGGAIVIETKTPAVEAAGTASSIRLANSEGSTEIFRNRVSFHYSEPGSRGKTANIGVKLR
jgi:hypothetical protein